MFRLHATAILVLLTAFTSAEDLGEVTTIATVDAGRGAYAGFSTGAVVYCGGNGHECLRVAPETTPRSRVTAIDVFQADSYPTPTAWVGYENGAIYRCSIQSCVRMSQAQPINLPGRR